MSYHKKFKSWCSNSGSTVLGFIQGLYKATHGSTNKSGNFQLKLFKKNFN